MCQAWVIYLIKARAARAGQARARAASEASEQARANTLSAKNDLPMSGLFAIA